MSQKPTEKQVLREICGEENSYVVEEKDGRKVYSTEVGETPAKLLNEELKKKWESVLNDDGTLKPIKDADRRKVTSVIL